MVMVDGFVVRSIDYGREPSAMSHDEIS